MKRYTLVIVICLLAASGAIAQTKNPVEGVWRIAENVFPGRNPVEKGRTVTDPQPSVIIFTRGYYSQVIVQQEKPRDPVAPAKDPQNLTDAEKIARYAQWKPFAANSGTYEIKGSTIIKVAIVAKNVAGMTNPRRNIWEFKLEGANTLILIPTGNLAATEPRIKLTRLE